MKHHSVQRIQHRPSVAGKVSPNELARQVIAEHRLVTDPFGNTYRYNGAFWEQMDVRVLEKLCCQFDTWEHTSKKRVQETAYFVQNYTLIDEGIPWNNLKLSEVPFKNGVYDLATGTMAQDIEPLSKEDSPIEVEISLAIGLREHSPEDYLETVWPVNWNPFAQCPAWDRYLWDCFGNLPEYEDYVMALEEFLGYLLMTKAPYKKALLCYGESNTGKTVLENVMIALVGEKNICHIPPDKMCDSRAIAPIKGKALNVIGELKFDTILSDSGFKRLVSTGEPVELDRKYKDPEMYRPFCKHAIFTNSLPVIHDYSEGVFNRLLLIAFPNVISPDRQDTELSQKLEAEIEGIALRALRGLERLIENTGQFTMPLSVADLLMEYREESNPMYEFLNDCFIEEQKGSAWMKDVRQALYEYLPKSKGWSPARITQMLKAAGCDIQKTTRKQGKGKYLIGYTLKRSPQVAPLEQDDTHSNSDATYLDDADF